MEGAEGAWEALFSPAEGCHSSDPQVPDQVRVHLSGSCVSSILILLYL